jgi:hypothetical protein
MENMQSNPLQKYFRQPKIYLSLPSKGEYYPEGTIEMTETGEFPVYPMTARDEIMIKTPDALINGETTTSVIQSCVPNILNAWHVPLIDLDAILLGIRIATYGEKMPVNIKVPVTGEEKEYDVNLREALDQLYSATYNNVVALSDMQIHLRPLTYKEFTETSLKTFEEQRIFNTVTNKEIPESKKLETFNESFKKLTELTIFTLEKSIAKIETQEGIVDDPKWIKEFVANAEKNMFEKVTDHVEEQRQNFSVKPLKVQATEEEIEQGVPSTFEVPISFDQSNFFG